MISGSAELSRRAALADLRILDSGPELSFDLITRLAASVFGVPIATISLFDSQRVWLKSACGADLGEGSRKCGWCDAATDCESIAVWCNLEKGTREQRFVAEGAEVRFSAGAPILWNGTQVGMLCIADTAPRLDGLDDKERACLDGFAALVEDELRLRATLLRADAADAERREWSEQFSVIGDAVSDAILTVDSEGIIGYANRAVEAVFGYEPREIAGGSMTGIFGPQMLDRLRRYFSTNKKTLDWRGTRLMVQHRSGRTLPIEFSIGEFQEHGDRKLAVVVRDHTEQLRIQTAMEARELEFRSLLENVQEVIFRTDLEGRWTFLNPAWTQLTGFSVAESLGRPFLEFTDPEDRPERARKFTALVEMTCPVVRYEVRYQTASGDVRWAEVYARLLVDAHGNSIGTCGTLQDIHERRVAQDRQEEARKYAETCNAAKNEFLSRVSHELRTPMNAILGFAQLLELADLPAQQSQGIQHILRAGRHLLALLDELMDISRIEAGKLSVSLEPVQLSDRIGAAIELIQPQAAKRGIAISLSQLSGGLVLADDKRLTQILLNLLTNAVNYNREGGSIEVWSERGDGNRIRTLVRDTGPGLAPDQIVKVFQPFERLGAERTKVPGTGLGLSVAKRLTELMGGSMGVESEIGAGSTFWFELTEGLKEQPLDRAFQAAGNEQPTVLYIDDSEANVLLVRQILRERSNARLIASETGGGGFTQACDALPDLILLDLHLPDMTGLEVLTRLRSNPVTGGIPVVVLTADVTPEARRPLDEQGVDGWLEKPLNVGLFVDTIKRLLERCVVA